MIQDSGSVKHLWISPAKGRPMDPLSEVRVLTDFGLESCAHARTKGKRQVLLVACEVLNSLNLEPGQIKENITTEGIDIDLMPPGTQLRIGNDIVLEVTGPCEPCHKMNAIRKGLCAELAGQRGTLAVVVQGGRVRVGDLVRAS